MNITLRLLSRKTHRAIQIGGRRVFHQMGMHGIPPCINFAADQNRKISALKRLQAGRDDLGDEVECCPLEPWRLPALIS
jgi:hypothetical protein